MEKGLRYDYYIFLLFIKFLRHVVMGLIDYTNTWLLRVTYITFYYAIKSTDKFAHVLDTDIEGKK